MSFISLLPVLWTMMMASFQTVLSSLNILQFMKVIDVLGGDAITTYMKILYYINTLKGTRVPIGQAINGIPNQASVFISRTPDTAERTFYTSIVLVVTNVAWLYSCLCVTLAGKQRRMGFAFYFWSSLSILNVFLDIMLSVIYINDIKHTLTLKDLINYINGQGAGIGSNNPATHMASWVMTMLQSKCVLPLLITFGSVFVFATMDYEGSNEDTEHDVENIEMGPIEIPRPGVDGPPRRPPEYLQDQPAIQEFQDPPSPPLHAIENNETERINGEAGKAIVKFPPSLLSIPQQLENIIANNAAFVTSPVIHHVKLEKVDKLWPIASTSKDSGDNFVDNHGRRGTAIELHSQLPWSYMPHSINRVEDQQQKTENDVVPPVPVPDYTVHPSYRKASVHRADGWKDNLKMKRSLNGHENIDAENSDIDEEETIVRIIRRHQSASEEGSSQKKYASASKDMDILY